MVEIELSRELVLSFQDAVFGGLLVKGIPNKKQNALLNKKKIELEKSIQTKYDKSIDNVMIHYINYFKRWNKSYPIEIQIESIIKGKKLPNVSILVDSMFHAEMKNRILTSGHDLERITGNLKFEVSSGSENYLKINNKEQKLKEGDIYLKDNKTILANILYGPALRTSINMNTRNALYLAWCPVGISEEKVKSHLNDILLNLKTEYKVPEFEIAIYTTK